MTEDGASCSLTGFGCHIVLSGSDGLDNLTCGRAGEASFRRGAGNDRFNFNVTSADSGQVPELPDCKGCNVAFVTFASSSGADLSVGALAAAWFQVRGDKPAQDGDDRSIFATATHILCFDGNDLAGGLIWLAAREVGITRSAARILIV